MPRKNPAKGKDKRQEKLQIRIENWKKMNASSGVRPGEYTKPGSFKK